MGDIEERWRESERQMYAERAAKAARGRIITLAVLNLLLLAVGVITAIDLRRLNTPEGAALAWTEAALFGECRGYERLSLPDYPDEGEGARCRTLFVQAAPTRDVASTIAINPRGSQVAGETATVTVEVASPTRTVRPALSLRKEGDRWKVVRDPQTCAAVRCI